MAQHFLDTLDKTSMFHSSWLYLFFFLSLCIAMESFDLDQVLGEMDHHQSRRKTEASRPPLPPAHPQVPDPDKLPQAPYKVEAKALRYLTVIQKQKERGISYDDLLRSNLPKALELLKKDRTHCFVTKDRHVCRGSTEASRKLQKLQHERATWGKAAVAKSSIANEEEQSLIRDSETGCSFCKLEHNQVFFHLHDGKQYRATGDVYVCTVSGLKHICTPQDCTHQITLPSSESIECSLTHKFLGQPMVHFEERRDREGDGRDGGLSFHAGPKRSGVSSFVSGGGGGGGRKRKSWNDSKLGHCSEGVFASLQASGIVAASSLVLTNEALPFIEHVFRTLFPKIKLPIMDRPTRSFLSDLCVTLLYDRQVRHAWLVKLQQAEQEADNEIEHYYRACRERKKPKRRDPFFVINILSKHLKPSVERLHAIGFTDRPMDRCTMYYFQEAILCAWTLLQYTPHARRYPGGIPLKKHAAGILYKLQAGFYVNILYATASKKLIRFETTTVASMLTLTDTSQNPDQGLVGFGACQETNAAEEEEALGTTQAKDLGDGTSRLCICFLPRHKFLECMPQKNDLNRYPGFKQAGICSNQVVDSEKLIGDCYESLLQPGTPLDTIQHFILERYIKLRDISS